MLASYPDRYSDMERKHMAFFQLKMVLGPCVESLVLLDRLAYLLEQARLNLVHVLPHIPLVQYKLSSCVCLSQAGIVSKRVDG